MSRVGIYSPYPLDRPSAAGMRVHHLRAAFERAGHRVEVWTPHSGKGLGLAQKISAWHPDIVIGTSPPLPPVGAVWMGSLLAGARFVVDAKEDGRALGILAKSSRARTLKERAYLRVRRFLYTRAQETWFLTPADEEEAKSKYRFRAGRVFQVPNGTDSRIVFDAAARKAERKILKVGARTPVLVYAGSVEDEEVEEFLEQYVKVPVFERACLVLVLAHDDSSKLTRIREMIRTNPRFPIHLRENVPLTHMSRILSAADHAIIPWPDKYPTSLPVKVFDYAGTGLLVHAKAPAQGSLAQWLESHSRVGESHSDWNSFFVALKKVVKKIPSEKARAAIANKAHAAWSRASICDDVVRRWTEKGWLSR